jgi:hypothetical protein
MEHREVRVSRVNATSLAMFEGTFAAVIGFAVGLAAWFSLAFTYTAATDSLLRGMLFGLQPGFVALILATILYFVAGWVVGLVHGGLFNLVASWMGDFAVASREMRSQAEAPSPATAPRRAEPTFGETVGRRRNDL